MISSQHAKLRIHERILMSPVDVELRAEWAYLTGEYSLRPPSWYRGSGQQDWSSTDRAIWVLFKDDDGISCAALIDVDAYKIITVTKKGH